MDEKIKQVIDAAKGNEEAQAILAKVGENASNEEILAAVAAAAEKLGIDFDASGELSDEELGEASGGRALSLNLAFASHLAQANFTTSNFTSSNFIL